MDPKRSLRASLRARMSHRVVRAALSIGLPRQRGQVLPIFVVMSAVLLGGAALLTDVAWWWVTEQRMQRAADAGALAGAVYLPGNQAAAFNAAWSETRKNGFQNGVDGVVVTPRRDPTDPRKLIVDIDSSVGTFFAKIFTIDSIQASVTGAGSYVLPVPMGSPQNYYGVGFLRDAVTTTTTTPRASNTDWDSPTAYVSSGGQWAAPWRAYGDGDTTEDTNDDRQDWRAFGLLGGVPTDPSLTIDGLEVRLRSAELNGSGTATDCRLTARISWDGGNTWSDPVRTDPLTDGDRDYVLGSASDTADWGSHPWTRNDLSDSSFQLRLVWNDGTAGCGSGRSVAVGEIEVRASYSWIQTTTTTTIEEVDVRSPEGSVLAPQNFWGAFQSQGAPSVQGDAYTTYYDTRVTRPNPDYDAGAYYQYGIEIPAGGGGQVWVFDPGFCHVDSGSGTGENWNTGSTYGYSPAQPVSAWYDLYNTNMTPYDTSDDSLVYGSGSTYRRLYLRDTVLGSSGPSGASPCDDLPWHNDWVQIAGGLPAGTYRLHTYSTDPSSPTDQRNTTALNAFAIWTTSASGTPRVYGVGAMEAYVRLPGGRSSEFYLAQIDAEHAGKTMRIKLWDPGDTGQQADLQILRPTGSDYVTTSFSYSAEKVSTHPAASSCSTRRGTDVTSVTTATSSGSLFNGCWLTIDIPLPTDYAAPHPSSDTVTSEGGWWKIRYIMGGSTGTYATDLTTWQVELIGNPVHLVPE